jgi:hypothetical protein
MYTMHTSHLAYNTNTDNYCWSHGFKVDKEHTRAMCDRQKPGHNREATMEHTMGWGGLGDLR